MTSSENVDNKQDKRSESDNVHYDNAYHEAHFCASKEYYMPAEIEPLNHATDLIYRITFRAISSNPHASPIRSPQVNLAPSRGIQDDDC